MGLTVIGKKKMIEFVMQCAKAAKLNLLKVIFGLDLQ
jgi:hypothetical protein